MTKSEITNRELMTDTITQVMQALYPSWSIDTLLTWPHDAIKMARAVCAEMSIKPTPRQIHEVCRSALAARKRGDLKRDAV